MDKVSKEKPVIAWWSGGVTSAVACKMAIDFFGEENVRIIFIDTFNEDDDTYRFKDDCEKWYAKTIETITVIGKKYSSIQEVWKRNLSLNISKGAVCSDRLKRKVRESWEKGNVWSHQVFGFDVFEGMRSANMKKNTPHTNPVFPLLMYGLSKRDCIEILQEQRIEIPTMYKLGFQNNNCFKTGCIQGGIGYWQKMKVDFPEKFEAMAKVEHELTDLKGEPVTMLKDQAKNGGLVFLIQHPQYPQLKDISMMKGRLPKPLFECNGFCGTNDFIKKNETEQEINYQE